MPSPPENIPSQLRSRLVKLVEQVQRDQAALPDDPHYAPLFDSLKATLHNLDRSESADKNLR